jgi:hypothetical protein
MNLRKFAPLLWSHGVTDLPTGPQLIASASRFLIEGGDNEAASVLLSCTVDSFWADPVDPMIGPRSAYDHLSDYRSEIRGKVWGAILAILPPRFWLSTFQIRAGLVELEPDWLAEMVAMARGKDVNNQAPGDGADKVWNRLRFRSATEVKIAEALDRRGVLFFPLCRARLNSPQGRVNREPDFLVCHDGKWGILEVDGEPYHPPQRTVHDHERDRLFQQHRVRVVSHFDSTDCYFTPEKVVGDFLALLDRAY